MPRRVVQARLDNSTSLFRRVLYYVFYDWTREMPRSKRLITWSGILIQGYAVYSLWARSLVWPVMWPRGIPLYVSAWLLYCLGSGIMNGMLTSEFVRKTQLEADQLAAQQIQRTLHPEEVEELPGYAVDTYYKPFRDVGGDYFDVIELAGNRTLFAVADVSGKGMPAALLAANIQALVRSIATTETDPVAMAQQINRHMSRYTPIDRFATAVFIVLSRETGELVYVNAGHNAPLVFGPGSTTSLGATGVPLGLFSEARYESRTTVLFPGGALLVFTDGLTDSIPGENSEHRLRDALADSSGRRMSVVKSLIDPKFNEDDVTILLVKRDAASSGKLARDGLSSSNREIT
jgi:serine phosphatase RsbU (regulator of sigma subunit)